MSTGRFREDLYYRINVIEIPLPPLRERSEDIPLLVTHFIEKYARELDRPVEGISEAAMNLLLEYFFPGNVRELENLVERAVALSRGPTIEVEALPPALLNPATPSKSTRIPPEGIDLEEDGVSPNDADDGDGGPNDLQNFPVLAAVGSSGGPRRFAAR